VFENRVLRIIFEPKRDEVTREWRKLHYKEHNELYFSSNTVRAIKSGRHYMGGTCSAHGGEERCIQGCGGET